jgi:type I restriction enzyme, S subunit
MNDGWHVVPMGQLCSIKSGKSDTKDAVDDGAYVFFDRSRTIKRSSRYLYDCEALIIPGEGTEFLPRHFKGKFDLHQRAYALFGFSDRVDAKFLYYFLHYLSDYFPRVAVGATVKSLRLRHFEQLPVALTSLPEQQRISKALGTVFNSVLTAKANVQKNIQNCRALFDSHLRSVFTERGPGWVETKLGALAEIQSGGTPSVSQKDYWNGNIPWYSSGELNSTYTTDPERRITKAGLNSSNAKLFPKGSLLVGMYDTAALKMSILDRDATFNQAVAGVKPNDRFEIEFVLHAINANKPTLLRERRGVRQKNLSLGKIKEIAIPLPGPAEQRAVLTHLRRVKADVQRLTSVYERKLTALEALKRSLLHKAFTGQL